MLQAFLNTANIEAGTDLLDRPEVAGKWLVDHGLNDGVPLELDQSQLCEIVGLREAFREVLAARHDNDAIPTRASRAIAETAATGTIGVDVDEAGKLEATANADGLAGALARLVLIALQASATGQWARLKVCTNDDCRWAFWDSSRNRSGRWCTMALCGNQAKVRSYRQRQS